MKKTITSICIFAVSFCALAATETVDGITWSYSVKNGEASIENEEWLMAAIPTSTSGAITIPSALGGYPVTRIYNYAFCNCSDITSITIPGSVTSIWNYASFDGCGNLMAFFVEDSNPAYKSVCGLLLTKDEKTLVRGVNGDVTIPDGVTEICDYAFYKYPNLRSVVLPDSVTRIGNYAFGECSSLMSVIIPESVQTLATTSFDGCDRLWTSWYRTLANLAANSGNQSGGSTGGGMGERITLVTTNIVIHYVTQSVPSDAVSPPMESGIVNVVAEVGAGSAVASSSDWAVQYPGFTEKFGNDFGAAITAQTGKRDGSGNPMFVWQDFVAGTDPTDSNDVFTASITFDATTGEPVISWSPELSAAEAAKRSYTTYGKVRLTDPEWTPIDGDEADYNFFKVEVKMRTKE